MRRRIPLVQDASSQARTADAGRPAEQTPWPRDADGFRDRAQNPMFTVPVSGLACAHCPLVPTPGVKGLPS